MKNVILQQFTTIDGLAADEDGQTNFVVQYSQNHDKSFEQGAMEFMDTVDTMLLGRKTYEMFSQYWPNAAGEDVEFAKKLNSLTKYVASTTLKKAPWGDWEPASVIDNPVAKVKELKKKDGKDIVIWGSLSLATALMKEGLIDEVQLRVVPVALGAGRQLFDGEVGSKELELIDATPHDAGLIVTRYRPR